jgi:hypothetical protein
VQCLKSITTFFSILLYFLFSFGLFFLFTTEKEEYEKRDETVT